MTEFLHSLLAWVSANPEWAHLIVFLVALSESLAVVGMIVPGVIMMLGAGALIATGALTFWPVCLWAIAGAVAGDGLSYWVGRHYKDRLRQLWPFSRYPEALEGGERFFEKYGGKSVAFGRFVGPVRAVIPLVAGMLDMAPARFLAANVISAIAWAPAYLLPGIVFGASLELAAEAALNLVVLALSSVLGLWFLAWMVHRLFLVYSPRAGRWVEGLLRWAELHPRMGEIARALADPDHPDARTLATLAGTLVLATLVFALIAGLAVTAAPLLGANRMVLDLALSLHTPLANHLMAGASRLADLTVILPLGIAVLGWLVLRGERRQASYWLAALAFGLLAGPLLKVVLQVPRPDIGLLGLSSWAFPSEHSLRATVVFGFLAVSLAGSMPTARRWLPYAAATLLVAAVSISRLYFGVHWLTDVAGSLTLGLAWVATLGLAYRRHTRPAASWLGLGAISAGVFLLAFGGASLFSHDDDLALYQPVRAEIPIPWGQWRDEAWKRLPQSRHDLRAKGRHPLSLQYAGETKTLARTLAETGWRAGEPLDADNFIRLLSPSLPLNELPVIPHVHEGRHEVLALVKEQGDDRRLVLRLWPTRFRIDGKVPLWVGNVTTQEKRVILKMLAVPTTGSDTKTPLQIGERDLSVFEPFRPAADGPLLFMEQR